MNNKKFYKTTITLEILSDEPMGGASWEAIAYEISYGGSSGRVTKTEVAKLTEEQLKEACLEHGTDLEFFTCEDVKDMDEESEDGNEQEDGT